MALIYVVEDDEPIRRELIDILARAGFADLLLKIEKRPTSPETVRFRGDFGRFYLI